MTPPLFMEQKNGQVLINWAFNILTIQKLGNILSFENYQKVRNFFSLDAVFNYRSLLKVEGGKLKEIHNILWRLSIE